MPPPAARPGQRVALRGRMAVLAALQPPPGGAELIDPKMRNSREFPKWLNAPETRKKLDGKRVMMYCTGGIRCERASALLTQLSQVGSVKPKEIVMVRNSHVTRVPTS